MNPHQLGGAHMAALVTQPNVAEFLNIAMYDRELAVSITEVTVPEGSDVLDRPLGDVELGGVTLLALRQSSRRFVHHPDLSMSPAIGDVHEPWLVDMSLTCLVGGNELGLLSRPGAPCRRFRWWVSPGRWPNRTCDSYRIRLSTSPSQTSGLAARPVADRIRPPSARPPRGERIAGIHQRLLASRSNTAGSLGPSPCARPSPARTTTGPPPHPGDISWQRAFP